MTPSDQMVVSLKCVPRQIRDDPIRPDGYFFQEHAQMSAVVRPDGCFSKERAQTDTVMTSTDQIVASS